MRMIYSSFFQVFLGLFLLFSIDALSNPFPPASSIHQQDLAKWQAHEQNGWRPWSDPQNMPVQPLGSSTRAITHEVHGYHPYWAEDAYLQYDWSLLSTVVFFGLELAPDGTIGQSHGWPWSQLVSTAHNHGTRVIITITNFSSSELATLLNSPTFFSTAMVSILSAVQSGGADGVNLDFEFVPINAMDAFILFVAQLNEGLHEILEDPYLSVATPAVDWSGGYQYAALAEHCDHLMIMSYNYHYSGSANTGPVAPLTGWGTFNVTWTVNDYMDWAGVSPSSILLGVPYYGYRWPAAGPEPDAATTAIGSAITFQTAYSEGLNYGLRWDSEGQTSWYRYETDQWYQIWFDDAVSLGLKYDYVKDQSLAGVGIWALSYDGLRPELWSALETAFLETSSVQSNPDPETASLMVSNPAPNPTSNQAEIHFWLEQASPLTIKIFDLRGRQITELFSGNQPPGNHQIVWSPQTLPSGTYLIQAATPRKTILRTLTWIR